MTNDELKTARLQKMEKGLQQNTAKRKKEKEERELAARYGFRGTDGTVT